MKLSKKFAGEGRINPDASLRDKQAIIINASAQKVWDVLINFESWSDWNDQIKSVKFDEIAEGSNFEWNINGAKIKSTISRVVAPELLSWTGSYKGLKAIHVWKIDPTEEDQTIVTCEESLQGFLTLFFGHQKLHQTLVYWLAKLKEKVESE
ncbi:MAG: SRPBCC domain-containing protein [Cyclobacteriaceae bacterium]